MYPTINHSFLSLFLLLLPGIQPFPYLPLMSPHHARVHPPDTRERAASPCINLPSRNRNDASYPSSPPPLTPFACKNIERNSSTNGSRSSSQFHHLVKWRNLISGPLSRIEHLRTYANQPGVYICVHMCVYLWSSRRSDTDLIPGAYQRIVPRVFWQIATSLLPICLHASG